MDALPAGFCDRLSCAAHRHVIIDELFAAHNGIPKGVFNAFIPSLVGKDAGWLDTGYKMNGWIQRERANDADGDICVYLK
jgi:hypothetical protein